MVYIATAVLVAGLIFKFAVVIFSPPIKGTLGIYPRRLPRVAGVLKDSFLVPVAFRKDRTFWLFIMLFHAAFLLLIVGHFELIQNFDILQLIPHDVFLGAGTVGIVLILSSMYFLFRRFRPPHSEISIPEDYILLILLFLTMVFGSHMHLAARYGISGFDIPLADYRAYISGLIILRPVIPAGITGSPHYVIIMLHIFFANIFMMIFPFSKMIHSVFIFITQNIKRK
jgi:nitrate reductase gamma subunit